MTHPLQGGVAVITGAASGFGLEASRIAASLGMKVVMADVQVDALQRAADEIRALGSEVLARRTDVSRAADVEALGADTMARFGAPNFVFNNAGVAGRGGLVWENSARDWEWTVGVNLMGVAHGVRVFTPLMLAAAARDAGWRGHIVNTASMAGLISPPTMGVYNATKHAVVTLSETLYQDLSLVSAQVHAHVLCPFFVPTGIFASERNRPAELAETTPPTASQRIAHALGEKAVNSGKVSAAQVAQFVFDAMATNRFYIFSHPQALASVGVRAQDIVQARNPTDPYAERPHVRAQLEADLRDAR